MPAVPPSTTVVLSAIAPAGPFPLATGPAALLEASPVFRGMLAFAAVAALGSLFRWRADSFVEGAIRSSTARPVLSLVYGIGAHAGVLLGIFYLTTQLGQLLGLGSGAAIIGVTIGVVLALTAAAVGFTVIGTSLASIALGGDGWQGPVVGAAIAGGAAALDPLPGGLLWFVVVSMGIGGPTRRWVNADALSDT